MKVLHVIESLGKGGAERIALNILNEMNKRANITAKLIFLEEPNDYSEEYIFAQPELCKVVYERSIFGKSIIDLSSINNVIREFNPDVIHTHLFLSDLIMHENTIHGIKYITHVHGRVSQYEIPRIFEVGIKQFFIKLIERRRIIKKYLNSDTTILCVSNQQVAILKSNLPAKLHSKIFMLNNAIEFGKFSCDQNRIIFPKQQVNIISVGSLFERKNHRFTFKILRKLLDYGINAQLTIVGSGPLKEELENYIAEHGLKGKVILAGLSNSVENHLKNSHLLIHSATYEAFGLVLIEAMASGLPVVCLDGGGNRDIVENGKNGFLLESQNPEIFAQKIIELIENPGLYAIMSNYAREYAKKYDIGPYVDKLLSLYQSV